MDSVETTPMPPEEAAQLPADVEEAEQLPAEPLPEEPPVDPGYGVEGPVFPDNELPEDPYPDNGLPEIPPLPDNTLPEIPAEPDNALPVEPGEPMPPIHLPGEPDNSLPAPVELDALATLKNIVAAARKRCAKYKAASGRRGPAENTLACIIAGAADKFPTPEQVLAAVQDAAKAWLVGYGGGATVRRHTLAQRIIDGRYNVAKK